MRFALVYALMVGVPLAALALVLEVGAGTPAPLALGGTWDLAVGDRPPLEVVQSGPVLELRWGEVSGRGRLTGAEVEGRLGDWTLRARRTADARLAGTLTRGEASPVVSFVATRARKARGEAKGH
jgi:hypothetical protein